VKLQNMFVRHMVIMLGLLFIRCVENVEVKGDLEKILKK